MSGQAEKPLKETPVNIDRNWTQRLKKEFNSVGEWQHTWNPVFFGTECNETYDDRHNLREKKIDEMQRELRELKEKTQVTASLRQTSSDLNGSYTLEKFGVDQYYLKRDKDLMSSDYSRNS